MPTCGAAGGEQGAAAQIVQVLADDAAVIQSYAIVGDQGRDFAQRVVGDDVGIPVDGVRTGRQQGDAIAQAEFIGDDHAFTDVGGGGCKVKFHGNSIRQGTCLACHAADAPEASPF